MQEAFPKKMKKVLLPIPKIQSHSQRWPKDLDNTHESGR